jgi:outer membrane immunogenic protein
MKHLLVSAAVAALFSGAAVAADLPAYEPAPIAAAAPVLYDWSGFYVGLQAGWAWGDADADFDNGAPSLSYDPDGFVGGGHAGFNFQFNSFVVGVEGDIEWTGIDGDDSSAVGLTSEGDIDVNWQASLRARGGLAIDRALVYATGGAAFADVDIGGGPLGSGPCCGYSDSEWGWTAGAGADFAVTNMLIVGVEYRYTDFGTFEGGLPPTFPGVVESVDLQTHAIRGRAGLKF